MISHELERFAGYVRENEEARQKAIQQCRAILSDYEGEENTTPEAKAVARAIGHILAPQSLWYFDLAYTIKPYPEGRPGVFYKPENT